MKPAEKDELRREYKRNELGRGARGKHYAAYQEGSNLVLLSPDVAEVFRTSEAVNEALRALIAQRSRSSAGE